MTISVLQLPVLVLNKGWQPIETVNVEKAFKMVCGEWHDEHGKVHSKVQILDHKDWFQHDFESWRLLPIEEGDAFVRTSDSKIRVPAIVIAVRYKKIPKSNRNYNRRDLLRRDNNTCQYCGKRQSPEDLTVDHILPRAKGGKSDWLNCCACCFACNQKKRDRTPQEAGLPMPQVTIPGTDIITKSHIRMEAWDKFFGR